jgi:hypothetical protein
VLFGIYVFLIFEKYIYFLQIKFFINLNVVRASAFLFVVGSQYAANKKDNLNGSTGHSVDDQISFRCRCAANFLSFAQLAKRKV